jgi:hypothetical protein
LKGCDIQVDKKSLVGGENKALDDNCGKLDIPQSQLEGHHTIN